MLCAIRSANHPCFFIWSAGAATTAWRFHQPNQPLIYKTPSLERMGPGNPCQGLGPVQTDLHTSPCFAFDQGYRVKGKFNCWSLWSTNHSSIHLPLKFLSFLLFNSGAKQEINCTEIGFLPWLGLHIFVILIVVGYERLWFFPSVLLLHSDYAPIADQSNIFTREYGDENVTVNKESLSKNNG